MTLADLSRAVPAIVPLALHGCDPFAVLRAVRDGEVVFADPAYGKRNCSIGRSDQSRFSPLPATEDNVVFA